MENKYFTELAHRLQAAGITTGHPERNQLTVLLNDQPVLFVSSESDVFLLPAGSNPPEASELYHKVAQTAEEVYAYCQSYMRHTCQASVCPYIPERLEAGTVSYQELAEGCLHMAGHQKLWNRLSSLPKGKSLPLVLEPAHRRRLSEWLEAGIATSCPHELAAAYSG